MSACLLCGHDLADAQVVNTIARNNTPQRSVACARCAFVQVDPMPTADELRDYYASGQYRREFPWLPVDGVPPDSPEYGAARDRQAEQGATWMAMELGGLGGKVLYEVGCGDGRVAAAVQRLGDERTLAMAWDDDPDMRAQAEARGVVVTRNPTRLSDVVYAHQVLEHTPDPVGTLRSWRSLLRDGGLVHIQVPTLEAMYGGASHFFQKPHVVNFTMRTLVLTLLRAGFSPHRVGISGNVLYATAEMADEDALTYEQALALTGWTDDERDDVAGLIAAHEAGIPKRSPVERWMAGEGEADDEVRREVQYLAETVSTVRDQLAKLARDLGEEQARMMDDLPAELPQRMYRMGGSVKCGHAQSLVSAMANSLALRMEEGGR